MKFMTCSGILNIFRQKYQISIWNLKEEHCINSYSNKKLHKNVELKKNIPRKKQKQKNKTKAKKKKKKTKTKKTKKQKQKQKQKKQPNKTPQNKTTENFSVTSCTWSK